MKKRNLFIANTYFQLITAINISQNNLKNDINDIIITDISVGMENKIDEIKNTHVFDNLFFIKSRDICYGNKVKKYLMYLFKKNCFKIKISFYDRLLFNNYDVLTYFIFDKLININDKLICEKFDEGASTYFSNIKINNINKLLRRILFKKDIDSYVSSLYLYHPELLCYKTECKIKKIPNFDKNNQILINIYNRIFNYNHEKITQKYIFFEESFFCDNKGIDDLDLILKISDIVGKNNIIVKLHPRNKVDRFEKYGIKTTRSNNIPWEIIQMNENFSSKVLLTISSASVLASKLYFGENIKTFLLYNCTNKGSEVIDDKYYVYLNKIKSEIDFNNIYVPASQNELIKLLKNDKNN